MDDKPPTFYASGVSIGMTPWDLTLIVTGRQGPTPKDVVTLAHIVFSPQHALIVSKILAREVAKYEAEVGKINLPPRLFNDLGIEP